MMEHIYLTRRNLLTLLSKLDRQKTGDSTQCTIIKYQRPSMLMQQTMDACVVTAVEDEVFYAAVQSTPGEMHPKDDPNSKEKL